MYQTFLHYVRYGDKLNIKRLLNDKFITLSAEDYEAFLLAVSYGEVEIVKLFLNSSKFNVNKIMRDTITNINRNCHHEILKIILKDSRFDITVDNHIALRLAANNNCYKCVKLLLKDGRIDINSMADELHYFALFNAIYRHNYDIVDLLLKDKRIDPSLNNNIVLRYSINSGLLRITKKLLKFDNVNLDSIIDNISYDRLINYKYFELIKFLLNNKKIMKRIINSNYKDNKVINKIIAEKLNINNEEVNDIKKLM